VDAGAVGLMGPRIHDFVSTAPDAGGEHISAGYPDECLDFTSFASSIAALVTDGEWLLQPFTQKMLAIVVDFASHSEEEAEASLAKGWNGAWEFPIGSINTVRSRVETNAQNALIERHLAFIATGETMRDFFWNVGEKLLDTHSCKDPDCIACRGRFPRDLAMALTLLADGSNLQTVHLFSKWEPSARLRAVLESDDVLVQWNPLSAIPSADLEENRYYTIWDGTESQYLDFLNRFWAPSWQTSSPPQPAASPNRDGRLTIQLPNEDPAWRSLRSLHFVGRYAAKESAFDAATRARFVKEANRICLRLLRSVRTMTTDPSDFTWTLCPEDFATLVASLGPLAQHESWAANIEAQFDPDDPAMQSLWEAWAPRLLAALRFAISGDNTGRYDVPDGSNEVLVFEHD
jgi:hypothetical protein